MSASPAQAPSGPASATPTTGSLPPAVQRKKAPTSIFNQKKKPVRRPAPSAQATKGTGGKPASGNKPLVVQDSGVNGAHSGTEEQGHVQDFSIVISKSALDRGLRYHAFKLHSKPDASGQLTTVNPFDPAQFTRPVHLHRRNAGDKIQTPEQSDTTPAVDDKERELMNARRAERQAEKEANQALIAPTGGEAAKTQKRKKPLKKVEDRFETPKQQARSQLLREEARPWHLEDFDGRNKWIGTYEAPLSGSSVLFRLTGEGFEMVPVEKWYKMLPVSKVEKKMDSEQIEKQLQQKFSLPRWWRGTQADNIEARKEAYLQSRREQQQKVKRERGSDDENSPMKKGDDYQADVDEIDFEFNDEFQDDDEGFVYGDPADDEAKEAEKKVRDNMRDANLPATGFKDEDVDWDVEEQKERDAEREERKRQKRLRRQLQKKERRNEYESDSDDLFSLESDSEGSEEERERTEEERKKEEARKAAALNGDKSGASTRGTNTPTGRAEKKAVPSLKRDADVSELSGNESSRKKARTIGRTNTPSTLGGARSLSPDSIKRVPSGYGSGSDTDTSRPGRARVDGKVRAGAVGSLQDRSAGGSRSGTPTDSRAQSPHRPSSTGPSAGAAAASSPPPPSLPFPTLDDVKAAIPVEGISIGDLVNGFKKRVAGRNGEFIALVKQAGKQDSGTKKIMRLDS